MGVAAGPPVRREGAWRRRRTAAAVPRAHASGEMGREREGKSRGCWDSPARGTEGEGAAGTVVIVASGEIESER